MHCRFVRPLINFIPDSLTYSVPLFLKRQCDRTLGNSSHVLCRVVPGSLPDAAVPGSTTVAFAMSRRVIQTPLCIFCMENHELGIYTQYYTEQRLNDSTAHG
jgi:hypothetical protein